MIDDEGGGRRGVRDKAHRGRTARDRGGLAHSTDGSRSGAAATEAELIVVSTGSRLRKGPQNLVGDIETSKK